MTPHKLKLLGLILAMSVAGGLLFVSFSQRQPFALQHFSAKGGSASGGNTATLQTVELRIDSGDSDVRNFSGIPYVTGQTVFSILKDVKVPMVYDPSTGAGVFIRQIGDKKNGDGKKYWQYWVNEKFAMVAADRYALSPGDTVGWKFATEQKE